jgi:hypothetical protein
MAITVKSSWKGAQVSQRVRQATVRGANKAAERLRGLAVEQAPKRDGILRGSAFVQPAEDHGGIIQAAVGFDTVYAARQHEEADYTHTDGKAHYLSDPARESANELGAILAAEVRRALS